MPRHRKTLKLASRLGYSRRETIGLMWDLWAWGMDNADIDGKLQGLDAADIAVAMDFPREKGEWLVSALMDAGYMEQENGIYIFHDWRDYAGKLNERRAKDKARKATESAKKAKNTAQEIQRNSNGNPQEIPQSSAGNPYATVPIPIPNNISPLNPPKGNKPRRRNPSTLPPIQEALFNRFWSAYPKREGIAAAEKAWGKIDADEEKTQEIISAVETAMKADSRFRGDRKYIPLPATWLNRQEWRNEYEPDNEPEPPRRKLGP